MKIILTAPALLLAACGTSGVAEPDTSTPDGDFHQITITVDNQPLSCVTMKRSVGDSSWGGLSCDWVKYHNQ